MRLNLDAVTLAGIIIISRNLPSPWGLVVGVVLLVVGLLT